MILTMNKNFLCGRNLSLTVAMMLLLLLPLALCTFYSSNRRHYTPKWLHHKVLRRVAPHLRERRDYYYEHTNSSLESNYSTVSSSSLFCEQQGCKRQGELCKGSFSNVDGCIEDCCAYGLECVQTAYGERRCNYNTLDMNCSLDSSLCMRGERCSINGSCVGMYAPGDGCLSDDDCILATNCSNSNHTCVGLQEGAACSPYSYECAYGLYCSPKTSVCTTQQSSGQSCDSPNACEWLHVCVEGSCRRLWTQSAGQPCIPDDWDYSNCDFGLECINGNCSHPQHEASVPCVHNSDCSHGEPCLCNEFLGGFYCDRPLYTDNCVSQFKSMLACAEEHECIIEGKTPPPPSSFQY